MTWRDVLQIFIYIDNDWRRGLLTVEERDEMLQQIQDGFAVYDRYAHKLKED